MSTRVAINGLGRIGRAMLKLVIDEPSLELVAVNDLVDVEQLAYLVRFDTAYGRYSHAVTVDGGDLVVDGRTVRTLSIRDPLELPWKGLDVELVFECTGVLTRRQDLENHLRAGARMVLLSAPSKGGEVDTLVHGANTLEGNPALISCASCTTNCITPVIEVVGRRIGIDKAVMTTIHAYTASQSVVDGHARASVEAGPRLRISSRPQRVPQSRRHVHCRSTRDVSTASRSGPRFSSGRSQTLRLSRRGRRPSKK